MTFLVPKIAPLINLSIRGLTLLGKFILLFYMAKYLSTQELGVYGLIVVIISYSFYLVGLDFYTYSTRELVVRPKSEWGGYIKKQGQLILVTYAVFLPVIFFAAQSFLSNGWLVFLIILIVLEHLNQEFMRLLIASSEAVIASNLLFIRSGLWCYIVIALMHLELVEKSLVTVLIFWIIFNLLALIYSLIVVVNNTKLKNTKKIQYKWVLQGLKICLPLLFSTLIVRAITTYDRVWLQKIDGIEVVAVYALFFGLTNSILSFLETSIFSFIYPKMLKETNNKEKFSLLVKKMWVQSILLITFVSLVLSLMLPTLLNWIGKEEYFSFKAIFFILLLGNIFYCLSMIPHYILYAKRKDNLIIISHILGLVIFVLSTLVLIYYGVSVSVAYGVCSAFLSIFIIKLFFSLGRNR